MVSKRRGENSALSFDSNFYPPYFFCFIFAFQKIFDNWKDEKALLQRDLNDLMVGDTFDLTMRYARLLAVIFICFIYSSGMPFLLPIVTFTLFTLYITDKYLSIVVIFKN